MSGTADFALALFERCNDAMPPATLTTRRLDHPRTIGADAASATYLRYMLNGTVALTCSADDFMVEP